MKSSLEAEDNFKRCNVELLPMNDNSNSYGNLLEKYKFTGQERDYSTSLDYMHFRFYASSMGRFLKPDNIIPDAFNPQSWNLYTYVNGNPANFNDPFGHYGKAGMTSQLLFGPGGALGLAAAYGGMWENPQEKGTMAPFVEAGTVSGYYAWVPIPNNNDRNMVGYPVSSEGYATINGEDVFVGTELKTVYVATEEMVVSGSWQWVETGGGGSGVEPNPYLDWNVSIGSPLLIGVSFGLQMNKRTEEFHLYLGFGVMNPGWSSSLTASNESSLTQGWNTGAQMQIWPFFAWQWGVAGGETFKEKGLGFPPGASITNYYVLPAIRLEPSTPESYKPAYRKNFPHGKEGKVNE